jgi:hypothetical protein
MLGSLRGVVLQHLRVQVASSSFAAQQQQGALLPLLSAALTRGFAGGFLDKDKVTERVMYVAKHFDKVDPAKVNGAAMECRTRVPTPRTVPAAVIAHRDRLAAAGRHGVHSRQREPPSHGPRTAPVAGGA